MHMYSAGRCPEYLNGLQMEACSGQADLLALIAPFPGQHLEMGMLRVNATTC